MARLPNISNIENKLTITLYGGRSIFSKRDSKYRAEVVACDCESCSLRENGMCLRVTSIARNKNICKYGFRYTYEGYTPAAKSCQDWLQVFKSDDCYHKLNNVPAAVHFAVIGDYYFIDTTYVGVKWTDDKYEITSAFGINTYIFIEKRKATTKFFVDLLTYTPHAILGGVIGEYRQSIVTLIMNGIRKLAPELYADIIHDYPGLDVTPNFVGKYVYVKTLKPGIDIQLGDHGVFHLSDDRKTLTCDDYRSAFLPFDAKTSKITIDVTDELTYQVKSNDETCEDTEIAAR